MHLQGRGRKGWGHSEAKGTFCTSFHGEFPSKNVFKSPPDVFKKLYFDKIFHFFHPQDWPMGSEEGGGGGKIESYL